MSLRDRAGKVFDALRKSSPREAQEALNDLVDSARIRVMDAVVSRLSGLEVRTVPETTRPSEPPSARTTPEAAYVPPSPSAKVEAPRLVETPDAPPLASEPAPRKTAVPKPQPKNDAPRKTTVPRPQPKNDAPRKKAAPRPQPKNDAPRKKAAPQPERPQIRPEPVREARPVVASPEPKHLVSVDPVETPPPPSLANSTNGIAPFEPATLRPVDEVPVEVEVETGHAEEDVLPPPRRIPVALGPEPDLPESYGQDRLVLLARDPGWAFAYWDLDLERAQAVVDAVPDPRAFLWFYEAGDKLPAVEVRVQMEHGSYYLRVPHAGRTYHAALVLVGSDGTARELLRSNGAEPPIEGPRALEVEPRFVSTQVLSRVLDARDTVEAVSPEPVSVFDPPKLSLSPEAIEIWQQEILPTLVQWVEAGSDLLPLVRPLEVLLEALPTSRAGQADSAFLALRAKLALLLQERPEAASSEQWPAPAPEAWRSWRNEVLRVALRPEHTDSGALPQAQKQAWNEWREAVLETAMRPLETDSGAIPAARKEVWDQWREAVLEAAMRPLETDSGALPQARKEAWDQWQQEVLRSALRPVETDSGALPQARKEAWDQWRQEVLRTALRPEAGSGDIPQARKEAWEAWQNEVERAVASDSGALPAAKKEAWQSWQNEVERALAADSGALPAARKQALQNEAARAAVSSDTRPTALLVQTERAAVSSEGLSSASVHRPPSSDAVSKFSREPEDLTLRSPGRPVGWLPENADQAAWERWHREVIESSTE